MSYERAERRHESERRNEEAARAKERQRHDLTTAKAKAAIEKAEREHDGITTAIEAERAALEKRSQAENDRWRKQKQKLDLAVRRARKKAYGEGERPQGAPARAAVVPRHSDPNQGKKILTPS